MNFRPLLSLTLVGLSLGGCAHVRVPEDSIEFFGRDSAEPRPGYLILQTHLKQTTVRSCNTRRSECDGEENHIPAKIFKDALTPNLQLTSSDTLEKDSPTRLETQAKIDLIKDWIKAFEPKVKADALFVQLDKELRDPESKRPMVQTIQALADSAVEHFLTSPHLLIWKMGRPLEVQIAKVIKDTDWAHVYACGMQGSLEDRIFDCSIHRKVPRSSWSMVMRSDTGHLIWKDDAQDGLYWGGRLGQMYDYPSALFACSHKSTLEFRGAGLNAEVEWELPKANDFKTAKEHQMQNALDFLPFWPTSKDLFWTSTPSPKNEDSALIFNPAEGGFTPEADRLTAHSVVCIGRPVTH